MLPGWTLKMAGYCLIGSVKRCGTSRYSVKGRMRLDDNVNTLSATLGGAEVSIEVKTD
jgi:hypothetical protein